MKSDRAGLTTFSLIALLLGSLTVDAHAQSPLRLPLDGYYRPGRCMPVAIEIGDKPVVLSGEGVIPMSVESGRAGRVAPVLVLGSSATHLRVDDREILLHTLAPSERIVACTTSTEAARALAAELFPGETIVPVSLDESQPLPGPSMAWESLDAIIVDHSLDSKLLSQVLANGTTVAVRSQIHPDVRWPWKQMGEYWILKADLAGPSDAIGGKVVYLPLQAWQPQQPAAFRRQVVWVGVMITLLMLATLLIRNRGSSIAAMLIVALLCGGSVAAWQRARPAARMPVGSIEVSRDGISQNDTWRYIAAGAEGANVAVPEKDHPVVFDVDHAATINLRAECRADGSMQWRVNLPPNARLAVLNRIVVPESAHEAALPTRESPLYELARQGYLTRGMRIVGEIPVSTNNENGATDMWPTVVVGPD